LVRVIPVILGMLMLTTVAAGGIVASQTGSSRSNPVSLGGAAEVGDFYISVLGVEFDATQRIVEAAEANSPPREGHVYTVIRMNAVYIGDDIGHVSAIRWSFIGAGRTELPGTECPLYGDPLDDEGLNLDLFPDGSTMFEICAQVPRDEVEDLLLYGRTVNSERVFFALHQESSPATPLATPAATPAVSSLSGMHTRSTSPVA